MMNEPPTLTLNRTVFSVVSLDDASDECMYWWAQTPQERLCHIERLRQINYGYRATERLQRILEFAELE